MNFTLSGNRLLAFVKLLQKHRLQPNKFQLFSHDFDSELETLNQQLCKALIDLQGSTELKFVHELNSGLFFGH